MLKCVVIDDESLAREVLEEYLNRLDFVQSIRQFGNARDAVTYLEHHEVDILFLDIEMPVMTGIELLKSLTQPPITVFTTAYRDYAFDGFELGVIDFLLKPVTYPRFLQTIEKVRDFFALKEQNTHLENTSTELAKDDSRPNGPIQAGPIQPGSIFVKSGVQRIKLNFSDVTYIQGLKDYAIIHTTTGKIVIKGSIKAMHDIFPAGQFLRVHKSFIVAIAHVIRIERGRLTLNGTQIPIGRNYKESVEEVLLNNRP